jgi:hypothetical protein
LYNGLKKIKNKLNFKIRKLKIKCGKLAESNGKKIVVIFIFLCMHFILFAMFEEKKFKFRNSKLENSKNKRKEKEN